MQIKAAVLKESHQLFVLQKIVIDDELRPHEILVKVVATGLCHTDIAVRDQQIPSMLPSILGHEGAGIVVKTGVGVTKVQQGDHVVMAPSSCGKCNYCVSGHPSYCVNMAALNISGRRLDGSCPYHDNSGREVSGLFFGQSSFGTYSLTSENKL